jgi:hypothetical protein
LLGSEDGMALIEAADDIEAVFITSDGAFHLSSGARERYEFERIA